MARNFAGAAFNYTPGELRNVFGPSGLTVDTTDRFGLGSLVPGVTANTGTSGQVKPSQPKTMEQLIESIIIKNANAPSQAEEFRTMVPLLKELTAFQADTATKNAERKFAQELFGAGIGALGRGFKTKGAGGDPAILGALAQAPLTGAALFQEGLKTPFTPAQQMSPRQNQSQRYFS